MKNPRFICRYRFDGNDIVHEGADSAYLTADFTVTDDSVRLTLKPKARIELTDACFVFDHDFRDDDRFFANGYQSWTTSREYMKSDAQTGVMPLAKKLGLGNLAGISADIRFCPDDE